MGESRLGLALRWSLGAAIAGPAGILLHELGHFGTAVARGIPGVTLHFASISYPDADRFWQTLAAGDRASAAAMYSLTDAGATALAGPVVTVVLSLACAIVLAVSRPADLVAAFCAATALTAGARSYVGVSYLLRVRPTHPDARPFFDEINAARAFGTEVDWIVWSVVACIVVSWILTLPRLRPNWWLKTPIAIVAPLLGILAWTQVGPLFLP
jgi:hypothetical protein